MFTGIITAIGRVLQRMEAGDTQWRIACPWPPEALQTGESIACSGVCLTVTDAGTTEAGEHWFAVETSAETLACTTLGQWQPGTEVNLERALAVGDRLGGHYVTGHVDGLATLQRITPEGDSHRLWLQAPRELARYIARKGSVTLDGVSLTVNEVEGMGFGVNIIPHTWQHTTLQQRKVGDVLNLEMDILARYVERLHSEQRDAGDI